MKATVLILFSITMYTGSALGQGDFIQLRSQNNFTTTLANLKSNIKARELRIFATIDHNEGARKAGMLLSPTSVLIFGNPKVGTMLMNCDQRIGLELPLKIVVWENEAGVFIGYIDPHRLEKQYNLVNCKDMINKVAHTLDVIVDSSIQ